MRRLNLLFLALSTALIFSGCKSGPEFDPGIFPDVPEYTPSPLTQESSVVEAGKARFTVLTPSMIRLECAESQIFEDRRTLLVMNRQFPTPEFTTSRTGGWLEIQTEELKLRYKENSGRFTKETLQIEVKQSATTWAPDSEATPLGTDSVLSKEGWYLIDDSNSPIFVEQEKGVSPWIEERIDQSKKDWYFIGYGNQYDQLFDDSQKILGKTPLRPRSSYGTWLNLEGDYSDVAIQEFIAGLDKHGISTDAVVLDKGWHGKDWSGYTWDENQFSNKMSFLNWCNQQGILVGTNLHPSEGIPPTHLSFRQMAKVLKLKRKKIDRVPFVPEDSRFYTPYFNSVIRPAEAPGQFWWLDWQKDTATSIKGNDPQLLLSNLFWRDWRTNPKRAPLRPFILNSNASLGTARYSTGVESFDKLSWSGLKNETRRISSIPSLSPLSPGRFFDPATLTSTDPELRDRWLQLSIFSPFVCLPAQFEDGQQTFLNCFDEPSMESLKEILDIRNELIPYIYSQARHGYDNGTPLVKPLYYQWPETEEAYRHPEQFLFGEDFLVRPVTTKTLPETGWAQVDVWFPEGNWTNWFTGESYTGPTQKTIHVPVDQIPLFVRSGTVIPTCPKILRHAKETHANVVLKVFPGKAQHGQTTLYEDDGVTESYHIESPEFAKTTFRWNLSTNYMQVKIDQTQGDYQDMTNQRLYEIKFYDVWPPEKVQLNSTYIEESNTIGQAGWTYDPNIFCLTVRVPLIADRESALIVVSFLNKLANRDHFHDGARGRVRFLRQLHQELNELSPETLVYAIRRCAQVSYNPEKGPDSLNYAYHEEWENFKKLIQEDERIPEAQKKRVLNQLNIRKTQLPDPNKKRHKRKPLI